MSLRRFHIRTLMIAVVLVAVVCAFPWESAAFAAILVGMVVMTLFAAGLTGLTLSPLIVVVLLLRPWARQAPDPNETIEAKCA